MMAPGVAWDICWAIGGRVGQPVQPSCTAAAFRGLGTGGNSQQLLVLRCAKSNGTFAPSGWTLSAIPTGVKNSMFLVFIRPFHILASPTASGEISPAKKDAGVLPAARWSMKHTIVYSAQPISLYITFHRGKLSVSFPAHCPFPYPRARPRQTKIQDRGMFLPRLP